MSEDLTGLAPPSEGSVLVLRAAQGALLSRHQARFAQCLTPGERQRWERYRVQHARDQFVASRGLLRSVLGGWLGLAPHAVPLAEGGNGKPRLDGFPDLHFNLSHSSGLMLLALSTIGPLGVDVEWLDRQVDYRGIAGRFFTPAESDDIAAAADPVQRFFEYWTFKEAAIKLSGRGLSQPLNTVRVWLEGGDGARLEQQPEWQFRRVPVPGNYAAAVGLASREPWKLEVRDWG